jgi:polyisoprenoid-binding protein YceI
MALVTGLGLTLALSAPVDAGDAYQVDPVHSWVAYKVKHNGVADSYGLFKDVSGKFTVDEQDPSKSSFDFTVKVDSVDSANPKRDGHLKSPDFFNAKQFPTITFKSKKVSKASPDGYEIVGDLTLHGVTKELSFKVGKIETAKGPRGGVVAGFNAHVPIKRSDFGMTTFIPMVGDDVLLAVGIEGGHR